ncbi:MAG TPA: LptA/OstA family protein [Allosphingosinicella sp.]|jgi:lipopolysaccharide export system protein LptA|uniref:LptA/OstA family protein n=1 Tax=Allosphingosinicella sp. TaxID=2823234 RepID=UPI002F29644F
MIKRVAALGFGAAAAWLALIAPALGQGAVSALRGHNTNAPIDVAADRIEVQTRADRAVFSGNVIAKQAELTLSAPRVTLAYTSAGSTQLQRIDATGGVTVRSPSETARGQYAIYDVNSRLITMLGGVTLTRGESLVRGGRLVLDLTTGRAVMDGGGPSSAAPGTTTTPGGRVTGTFTVPQRSQ